MGPLVCQWCATETWKDENTCFGECQLTGRIGELLYFLFQTASCFYKAAKELETMCGMEVLVILTVATFYLAIVPWCIWLDALVTNTEQLECLFKECFPIRMLRIEPVYKFWVGSV